MKLTGWGIHRKLRRFENTFYWIFFVKCQHNSLTHSSALLRYKHSFRIKTFSTDKKKKKSLPPSWCLFICLLWLFGNHKHVGKSPSHCIIASTEIMNQGFSTWINAISSPNTAFVWLWVSGMRKEVARRPVGDCAVSVWVFCVLSSSFAAALYTLPIQLPPPRAIDRLDERDAKLPVIRLNPPPICSDSWPPPADKDSPQASAVALWVNELPGGMRR